MQKIMNGECPICREKHEAFNVGKVGARFAWLLQKLETKLYSDGMPISAQLPEVLLINKLDELIDRVSV